MKIDKLADYAPKGDSTSLAKLGSVFTVIYQPLDPIKHVLEKSALDKYFTILLMCGFYFF